jgi:hypothetical protein
MPPRLWPSLWQGSGGRAQLCVRRRRIFQEIKNPQTIPGRKLHVICRFDDGFGRKQGVAKDKIRQVRVSQGYGAQEKRLFLGSNPQGHPAIVFDSYSWHMYTFK